MGESAGRHGRDPSRIAITCVGNADRTAFVRCTEPAAQIATVNKDDLDALVTMLPARVMDRVSDGLRWFLKLEA